MKVSLLPAARADILAQVEYLLDEFAYGAAERFPSAVEAAIAFVVEQPQAGAPSLAGLRAWAVPGFPSTRMFYHCPTPEDLHVVRVLHGARDLPAILEDE